MLIDRLLFNLRLRDQIARDESKCFFNSSLDEILKIVENSRNFKVKFSVLFWSSCRLHGVFKVPDFSRGAKP